MRGLLRSRAFWVLAAPFFVCGLTTTAIGAWLPGIAFDASGSYDEVMVIAAVMLGIASVTCLALPRPARLAPAPAPALP